MFLICLLLIGLIAITTIIDTKLSTAEQAEFISIPVRVSETKDFVVILNRKHTNV